MSIREYKVTLQFPDSVTSPSTVKAFTVEDAAAQVRIARAHEAPFQVIAVQPVGEVEVPGDDPDRIFMRFKKDLAAASPPMGTQEVQRLREDLAQTILQGAACLAVAEGNFSEGEIKQGHQHWTPVYQATLDLYRKFEAAFMVVQLLEVQKRIEPNTLMESNVAAFRKLHPKPRP